MSVTADILRFEAKVDDIPSCFDECLSSITNEVRLGWFLRCYADWNATFASGVTALTSLIGQHVELFADKTQPVAVSDRSVLIASHIFDAARDEYDDGTQAHRDPHRSLAQATLIAVAELTGNTSILSEATPVWLKEFRRAVVSGYIGNYGQLNEYEAVLAGIGYHLGSELLADKEFSNIDNFMRIEHRELVQKLMRKTIELHGGAHRCYAWIGIHSGSGGGVEMDHFDAGIQAANLALKYLNTDLLSAYAAETALIAGFRRFAEEQSMFFDFARALVESK